MHRGSHHPLARRAQGREGHHGRPTMDVRKVRYGTLSYTVWIYGTDGTCLYNGNIRIMSPPYSKHTL